MNPIAPELLEEHKTWLDQIRNWEHEISDLAALNGKMVVQANSVETRSKIDHFENRFTIELGRLDSMKHNIKVQGGNIARGKEEIDEFARYFEELRSEFNSFRSNQS